MTEETVKRLANDVADKFKLPEKRLLRVYGSRSPEYMEVFCYFSYGRPETTFELFMGFVQRNGTEEFNRAAIYGATDDSIAILQNVLKGIPHDRN